MSGASTSLWLFHRRQAKPFLQRAVAVGNGSRSQSRSLFAYSRATTATVGSSTFKSEPLHKQNRPVPLAATAAAPPRALQYRVSGIRWLGNSAATVANNSNGDAADASETPIKIFFASQTGTAQLFGQDLAQALQEDGYKTVSMQPLQELDTNELFLRESDTTASPVHVILASTTGVGEPPDHARPFYEWLVKQQPDAAVNRKGIRYAVFGLGNSLAHPNHYNTVAKTLDSRLKALGHESVLPLCLGDDGDCIDDDFDQWLSALRTVLAEGVSETRTLDDTILDTNETLMKVASDASSPGPAPPIRSSSSSSSSKYPTLNLLLEPSVDGTTSVPARAHLLDICPSFYKPGSRNFPVSENRLLSHAPTSNGLCELQMHLPDSISYETGDHFVLHPRNGDCVVQAFLQAFGVSPDAVITGHDGKGASSSILLSSGLAYPHPTGITVYETLSHCVDLESPPSPSLARLLTGKPNLDYKREIAHPRRTVLELLLQNQETCQSTMSLSHLLWQLPPLQPRYYSIASSAAVHPNVVSLTYRPVQYVTSRGIVRHGVCTSYMRELSGKSEVQSADPSQQPSLVVATIRSNPSFRLPAHPATPIWMIAGGCGVAPIRAFLQERLHRAPMIGKDNYGPAWLFLGFRNPADQVYTDLAQQALAAGAITKSFLSFQMGCESAATDDVSAETASVVGCGLVSEQVRRHGAAFWEHCQAGGVTYLCGGARTFGVAIENEVHAIFQEHGGLSEQEATAYLQELIREGRFSEDLAD